MKSLKLHFESLLDDDNVFLGTKNDKKVIEEWIKNNYVFSGKLTISDDFVVDCGDTVKVKNKSITSLTNGLFRWGKVNRSFNCTHCNELKSLEGAPKEVGWSFVCSYCHNLTSLQGAPKKVGGDFWCDHCGKLETLEGAPEKVGGDFVCSGCENLKSLEGAPEKFGNEIFCANCNNLKITDSDRKKYKIEN